MPQPEINVGNIQTESLPPWRRLAAMLYVCLSAWLALLAPRGYCAIEWMNAIDLNAYSGWHGLWRYMVELRTGIPPLQSLTELAIWQVTGSLWLCSRVFYPLALFGVYATVLFHRPRGHLNFCLSASLCLIFQAATLEIHRMMPLTYDLLFPWLAILFVTLQSHAGERANSVWQSAGMRFFLSGFLLAWLELTRPFILLILPVLAFCSSLAAWRHGRRALLLHLAPLVLLSGGWHAKLIFHDQGQIVWSNHTGFNLQRAWREMGASAPDSVVINGESMHPCAPRALNTFEHYQQSQALKSEVLRIMRERPLESITFGARRLLVFLKPQTSIYRATEPDGVAMPLYPWAARIALLLFFSRALLFYARAARWRHWRSFIHGESQLILLTLFSMLVLGLGEAGEEARLFISILPFLAVLPGRSSGGGEPDQRHSLSGFLNNFRMKAARRLA